MPEHPTPAPRADPGADATRAALEQIQGSIRALVGSLEGFIESLEAADRDAAHPPATDRRES